MKQKVTINLDRDLWLAFRAACIQRRTSASAMLEVMIREQMWGMQQATDEELASPFQKSKDAPEGAPQSEQS